MLLGATSSPHSTIMLNDGRANAISADDLRLAMERSAQLGELLLRYVLAFEIRSRTRTFKCPQYCRGTCRPMGFDDS